MHSKASLILGTAIMICAGVAVFMALDWPWKAKLFPLAIGIPVFFMAAAEVLWGLLDPKARSVAMDFGLSENVSTSIAVRRTLLAVAWMCGFFAGIVLLGFPFAVPLLGLLYVRLQGREGWLMSGVVALAMWAFFYVVFDRLLHLPFSAGLIQGWLGLG